MYPSSISRALCSDGMRCIKPLAPSRNETNSSRVNVGGDGAILGICASGGWDQETYASRALRIRFPRWPVPDALPGKDAWAGFPESGEHMRLATMSWLAPHSHAKIPGFFKAKNPLTVVEGFGLGFSSFGPKPDVGRRVPVGWSEMVKAKGK